MKQVQLVEVLIASPSDTSEDRDVVEDAIHLWNSRHADQGVVFLPRRWERDARPAMGEGPQSVINDQIVDRCDVLIGIFWTRMGGGGTREEIERFISADKPVHLYFCDRELPPTQIETEELERIREYKQDLSSRGLLGSYFTSEELASHVYGDLTSDVGQLDAELVAVQQAAASDVVARIATRRRRDGRGDTHLLVLHNRGTGDALDVDFEWVVAEDERRAAPSVMSHEPTAVPSLVADTSVEYAMTVYGGTSRQLQIRLTWTDATTGESKERTQSVSI